MLSIEHVYDALGGSTAWPPNVTDGWIQSQLSQYGLLFFFMIPSVWLCVEAAKKGGLRGTLGSKEFLVVSPVLGLIASVAVATGEARYRIPFDGLFIIVGSQFYYREYQKWRERVAQSKQARANEPQSEGLSPDLVPVPAATGPSDGSDTPDTSDSADELPAPSHDLA
jgi:hypothetical protein